MASYKIPEDCLYTKGDTWIRRDADGVIRMGITDYAQQKLRKIEYLSLPEEGETVEQFEALGEIESMKSLSELMAPVTGSVALVNEEAADQPGVINEDPYGRGWILALNCDRFDEQSAELLNAQAYRAYRGIEQSVL
ncbi:MAG: glycine cleavage system protein GcvH [Faecousia sp.]